MTNLVKLLPESIIHIPFNKYENNFTFIVNSNKYETSSFFADLLSPIISSRRSIDPTFNEFIINTKSKGDFNIIIKLNNFESQEIPSNDLPFFYEVLTTLGTTQIDINDFKTKPITNDNIIERLSKHQEYAILYKEELKEEIEYAS